MAEKVSTLIGEYIQERKDLKKMREENFLGFLKVLQKETEKIKNKGDEDVYE